MPVNYHTMKRPKIFMLTMGLIISALLLLTLSSCDKQIDRPVSNPPNPGYTIPAAPDYYFSRVRYFSDHRTPATDTIWTLHLVSQALVDQYTNQDGYLYTQTSTYSELGTMWIKKK